MVRHASPDDAEPLVVVGWSAIASASRRLNGEDAESFIRIPYGSVLTTAKRLFRNRSEHSNKPLLSIHDGLELQLYFGQMPPCSYFAKQDKEAF